MAAADPPFSITASAALLERPFAEHPGLIVAAGQIPLVTSGSGPVFSVHFRLTAKPRNYRATLRADAARYAAFRLALLHRGIYVLPDGRWYVGAVHDEAELAHALAAIDAALGDLATAA